MLQLKYMKKFLWSLLDKIVGDVKFEYKAFWYHNFKNTHKSGVSIFFERREGFHGQCRGNVLLWPKSDESKKKPGPLLLVYSMATPIHIKKNIISYQSKNSTWYGNILLSRLYRIKTATPEALLRAWASEFSFIFINWWIVWSGSPRSPTQWFMRLTRGGRFR